MMNFIKDIHRESSRKRSLRSEKTTITSSRSSSCNKKRNINIERITSFTSQKHQKPILFKISLSLSLFMMVSLYNLKGSYAILNCLTPSMFRAGGKMHANNLNYPPVSPYDGSIGSLDQRQAWNLYQQQQQLQMPAHSISPFGHSYPQSPMKRLLFQPHKWKAGGLFGHKLGAPGSASGWSMSGLNFYRPGYGYGPLIGRQPALFPGQNSVGYPVNGDLNVAPFSIPSQFTGPQSPVYGDNGNSVAGWSLPTPASSYPPAKYQQQQSQININYDQGIQQQIATLAPNIDPYGGQTKGGQTNIPSGNLINKLSSSTSTSTTKNLLVANGGYNFYDSHLLNAINNYTNKFGYSYPDWYSSKSNYQPASTIESPARISQQLLKLSNLNNNLRSQRIQQQQQEIANLIGQDEPRFMGLGKVDNISALEARLTCFFGQPIDQANRPIWVKFQGLSGDAMMASLSNGSLSTIPPFNCVELSQCRIQEIETNKDSRYSFENGPRSSSLVIRLPKLSDLGTYRCSALTKPSSLGNLQTSYQIIRFGGSSK